MIEIDGRPCGSRPDDLDRVALAAALSAGLLMSCLLVTWLIAGAIGWL